MKFSDNFILALKSVKNHKTNSLISSIGVIIFTLILFVSICFSSQINNVFYDSFSNFGANTVLITPNIDYSNFKNINETDFDNIKNIVNSVKSVSPVVKKTATIKNSNNDISVLFSDENFKDVWGANLLFGDFYSESDYIQGKKSVVITEKTALEVFGFVNCIGQEIEINVENNILNFTVCGVTQNKESSIWDIQQSSNLALIPLSVLKNNIENSSLNTNYCVLNKNVVSVKNIDEIKSFLNIKYNDISNAYSFSALVENSHLLENILNYFNLFIIIILGGCFVLVGVGISNMTVSKIYNRKNEIAIKKALGARKSEIIMEMFLENMIICVSGAILGLILGFISVLCLNIFSDFEISFNIFAVIIPIAFTILISIFASVSPTFKILRLYPINILKKKVY